MHLVCLSIVRHVESVASFGWKWNLKLEGVLQKVTEKLNIFNWIIEKITVSHWAGCQGNNSRISPPTWRNSYCFPLLLTSIPTTPEVPPICFHRWSKCYMPNATSEPFSWAEHSFEGTFPYVRPPEGFVLLKALSPAGWPNKCPAPDHKHCLL